MEMLVLEIGEHQSMDLTDNIFMVCKEELFIEVLKKMSFLNIFKLMLHK